MWMVMGVVKNKLGLFVIKFQNGDSYFFHFLGVENDSASWEKAVSEYIMWIENLGRISLGRWKEDALLAICDL